MSEIQVPLVNETKSKKAELMNWTLYISLFLSLIATLISVAGYFKKVGCLLSPFSPSFLLLILLILSQITLSGLPTHPCSL